MKKHQILYVVNHLDWFWSHRLPLAVGAREVGMGVTVAAAGAARERRLGDYGFRGIGLPPDEGFAPLAALRITLAIAALLRETRPDIVHAITLKYAFLTGLAARLNPRVSLVFTIAGLGYLFSDNLKPRILRFVTGPFLKLALRDARIILQNPDDRALLLRSGFVTPAQCILIKGSGVDTKQLKPQPEPSGIPLVLMPTRLVRDKGVAVFIEAAKILKSRGIEARFKIAGGVTSRNPQAISQYEMERMIAGSPVEWLGKVADMPALYAASTLIVYPSYYGEGIPRVLLEAAAMGKAIVTTDHPGCREAVCNGENGLLVPIKNPEATAAAIEKLLWDEPLRKKMGAAGRARAETEFDANLIVAQTLKVYESL